MFAGNLKRKGPSVKGPFRCRMNAHDVVLEEGICFRTSDYFELLGGKFLEVSACDFLKKLRCTTCMSNSVTRNQLKSFKGVLSTRNVLADCGLLVIIDGFDADCFLERNVLFLRVGAHRAKGRHCA